MNWKASLALLILCLSVVPQNAQAEHFGALSYDARRGAWGTSWDHLSQQAADEKAQQNCQAHGAECQVYVRFQDGCGAFAVGTRGGWGWGTGATKEEAKTLALESCTRSDQGCRVTVWGCNSALPPAAPKPAESKE